MPEHVVIDVGRVRLTRVPYFDVALPAEALSLDETELGAESVDAWVDAQRRPNVGQASWVVESGDRVLLVDPCGAADAFIRTGPDAVGHQEAVFAALADAGYSRGRVDAVVLSHLDGIGMTAAVTDGGGWEPAFPAARVIVTDQELAYLSQPDAGESGIEAFRALVAAGAVDGVPSGSALAEDVTIELTAGHGPGHALIRVESDGELAVLIGHLALTPIHLFARQLPSAHFDLDRALAALASLVSEARDRGSVLIGPLWPHPGAVTIDAAGAAHPLSTA